jgi:signal transduction histidine kinase
LRPGSRGVVPAPPAPVAEADHEVRRQHQLSHDIQQGLGTVMMLASLLVGGPDVGPEGRRRARQLLGEVRWVEELQRAHRDGASDGAVTPAMPLEPIRLDLCAREVVSVLKLSTPTTIEVTSSEAWAHADRLAFWRALRNIVDNAIRAAGPSGQVAVRVEQLGRWAEVQVDDDGPGFGAVRSGVASLGLDIVQQSVTSCGGRLEIRRGDLGGCCVRLRMPAAAPPDAATPDPTFSSHVAGGIDAAVDL